MIVSAHEQKNNRKKWIEALRSGNYVQGRYKLKIFSSEEINTENDSVLDEATESYCCLGVACDVSRTGYWGENGRFMNWEVEGEDETEYGELVILTDNVMDWLGLRSENGSFDVNDHLDDEIKEMIGYGSKTLRTSIEITTLNDELGLSFKDIARIIELEPSGLIA